jgi:Calcineurin-like phosphoesterase
MSTKQLVVTYARLQDAFHEDPAQMADAVERSANQAANGDPKLRAQLIADWNQAVSALQQADQGNVMSTAQDPIASRLQTLIASKAAEAGQVAVMAAAPGATPGFGGDVAPIVAPLEVKFDNEDLAGWLGMAWKLIFKPDKHPWVVPAAAPEKIDDNARIAIFADWGTGLYGAPAITQSIQKLDRCDVALHLGDTYYSGSDDEIHDRLVGDWPHRNGTTINRSLNGNHEMYSGGQGYFTALAGFFHQSASCFAMQNSKWILACLDTAYQDFDIDDNQVAWLNSIVAAAGARKLILFSHHQPFSQLDLQGPKIQVALHELLNNQRIHAWFWGHEHRLVLYEPHTKWGFKGRCVGNGGFPAFRDDLTATPSEVYEWVIMKTAPHAPAAKLLDGPNFWIPEDPMRYSPHGFLTLDFDGDKVWETYYTPDKIAVSERMQL